MKGASALLLLCGWATTNPRVSQGRLVYTQACAACHGQDGRGNPEWESDVRPVEFTDCGTVAEPTEFWESIVRRGGSPHGLSSIMPAFEQGLAEEDIAAAVAYLRTLCPRVDAYPPGDLNFRRLLATGKAFPEAEWVLRLSDGGSSGSRSGELEIAHENRIGPRFQYEIELPLRYAAPEGEGRGAGDLKLGAKHVLHFDVPRRQILSAGLALALPTGSEAKGLGGGTWAFSPYLAYGKAWGRTMLQSRIGLKLPTETDKAPRLATYALGLSHAMGLSRSAWTPAAEWVGDVETETGRHSYGVWLELSKPLNRLGHVIGAAGVQVPVRPRSDPPRLELYLLWDFGDGPFWQGW
ncbi:MAG TPA: c-type cytochrome [Vicinamibacteria bacterium]|nr:c-type cytochrome [Vicinamibacteria bacterium]